MLAVASELSVDEVLQRLVDSARELAGARYAALGIPDGAGGFRRFLVSGMSDELIAGDGPAAAHPRDARGDARGARRRTAPRTSTTTLASAAGGRAATRTCARSWACRSSRRDEVIGAFYLTEKEGAAAFDAADQELIELLAAHAAIAITNARLYERSRELSILSERNRLALELHDVVSQKLFSLDAHGRGGRDASWTVTRPPRELRCSACGRSRARRSTSCAR